MTETTVPKKASAGEMTIVTSLAELEAALLRSFERDGQTWDQALCASVDVQYAGDDEIKREERVHAVRRVTRGLLTELIADMTKGAFQDKPA